MTELTLGHHNKKMFPAEQQNPDLIAEFMARNSQQKPTIQDAISDFMNRMGNSASQLTSTRRPTQDPSKYFDEENVPREGYIQTGMKNILGGVASAFPDTSFETTEGMKFDPTGGMATGSLGGARDLKRFFQDSRTGRLLGNVKPWEMHPDDFVRHMRDIDPQFWNKIEAFDWSPTAQGVDSTFEQTINPRSNYKEVTGARAIDLAGSNNPEKINKALSDIQGIEAPGITVAGHWPQVPFNVRRGDVAPSVREARRDFPWMPAYGAYGPEQNQMLILTKPHGILHPQSNQENMIASTVAHELEHAADFQKGRFRPKNGFESLLEEMDPRYSNPETSVREIDAASLSRGPNTWMGLTRPRAELLKSYGKIDGVPSNLAPARAPKNQYDLKFLREQNPRAVEAIGSRGHFATLDNFETDWAQKSLAEQAIKEGLDVNPAIIDLYPDLKQAFSKYRFRK